MISSLLSDLLSIFTAHLYICYVVSGAVFRYQLMVAASLWNLFRGKHVFITVDKVLNLLKESDTIFCGEGRIPGTTTLTSCFLVQYYSRWYPS